MGTWSKSSPTGHDPATTSLSAPPQVNTSNIFYVDIAAMMPDGTLIPNLRYQVGSSTQMVLTIDGKDVAVNAFRSPELVFPSTGRIGIAIPNNQELFPPEFW